MREERERNRALIEREKAIEEREKATRETERVADGKAKATFFMNVFSFLSNIFR